MSVNRIGRQSAIFKNRPVILSSACVAGKKEGEGPLGNTFDRTETDPFFRQKTWEQAESVMVKETVTTAINRAKLTAKDIDCVFGGDLLNQCIGTSFGIRDMGIPFYGIYGACSTMAESISLGALMIDGGYAKTACAFTSSHFCSAERQYRFPLEYGSIRPPASQWTVTGCGCVVLGENTGKTGVCVTGITTGKIVDLGIRDANNMGAAMAPAAYHTLKTHFEDFKITPDGYDLILTGDLGAIGHTVVSEFFKKEGVTLKNYTDCGMLIFDRQRQKVNSGGSGCGCSAVVLTGYIMSEMKKKKYKRVLFAATGALLSPTSTAQGESIPGICHAVSLEVV